MKVLVRPMEERDLEPGHAIYRSAFASFLKIDEAHIPDFNHVRSRYRANPRGAISAEINGELVGTMFAARWGSLAVVGPSTVRPTGWTGQAGKLMLERALALAAEWRCAHVAGFTFSNSPRHIDFFQREGIWPRFLTTVMTRSVRRPTGAPPPFRLMSSLAETERTQAIEACARLTHGLLAGMDLREELASVLRQGIGDILLTGPEGALEGMAVLHVGAESEGGTGNCYVKFGAVGADSAGAEAFERLLDAVEAYAAERKIPRMMLGMNLAHSEAYRILLRRGMLTSQMGVALHGGDDPLYKRPGLFVIDDWR